MCALVGDRKLLNHVKILPVAFGGPTGAMGGAAGATEGAVGANGGATKEIFGSMK